VSYRRGSFGGRTRAITIYVRLSGSDEIRTLEVDEPLPWWGCASCGQRPGEDPASHLTRIGTIVGGGGEVVLCGRCREKL
jgi:hypothetical protein